MEVTEIRIQFANNRDGKLKAFCTITFDDCFVVRDLKIIRGTVGLFVAMPSRKLADLCPNCRAKNHLRARYCNECGSRLAPDRAERGAMGRAKLYADIAHPVHSDYREELQRRVLEAYDQAVRRDRRPGRPFPGNGVADIPDEAADFAEAPHDEPDRPNHSFGEGIFP